MNEPHELDVLVGEWVTQVQVPGVPAGRVAIAWEFGRRFLLLRSTIPQPEYPDSLAVVAPAEGPGAYTQHYYDSRGVVRLYAMTWRAGVWTLLRVRPDFSPLPFAQRFEGVLSADAATIDGRWETSDDGGAHWKPDFGLRYTRARSGEVARPNAAVSAS